ncbi:hypothetical protein PR202_gb00512 [Eleusine coracana subsp. coracana]|uniref:Uncharacterized protein n=1 Tax=Eleusine coracana subsp. coracana TaxID=191504 RepID=A0AAV5DRR4_ELECO|nr:hypothetical protein PR202_gb00512 [Eleusine coracana subsp. coracana]
MWRMGDHGAALELRRQWIRPPDTVSCAPSQLNPLVKPTNGCHVGALPQSQCRQSRTDAPMWSVKALADASQALQVEDGQAQSHSRQGHIAGDQEVRPRREQVDA